MVGPPPDQLIDVAYVLEALIFPAAGSWPPRLAAFEQAALAGTEQLRLLPLTEDALRQMGRAPDDEPILGFLELTEAVRRFAADMSAGGPVVYVHAEISGGTGTQGSMGWHRGEVDFAPVLTANHPADLETDQYVLATDIRDGAINQALRHLGVRSSAFDEFDTVGLGRHRWTDEWV